MERELCLIGSRVEEEGEEEVVVVEEEEEDAGSEVGGRGLEERVSICDGNGESEDIRVGENTPLFLCAVFVLLLHSLLPFITFPPHCTAPL